MPRIYTKTGDDGTTGLLFGGRIGKDDLVTEAYGTTDEAVAALGLARALTHDEAIAADVLTLQSALFVVGADLATNPEERDRLEPGVALVTDDMVGALEARIDAFVAERPLPQVFLVPGANPANTAVDPAPSHRRTARREPRERGDRPRAFDRAPRRTRGGRPGARRSRAEPGGARLPEPPERSVVRAGAPAGERGRTRQPLTRGPTGTADTATVTCRPGGRRGSAATRARGS